MGVNELQSRSFLKDCMWELRHRTIRCAAPKFAGEFARGAQWRPGKDSAVEE